MQIKNEEANDAERITLIQFAAFDGHPIHAGAEATEHLIVERLRAEGALSLSLIAEENGEAVGHIAMSAATVGKHTKGWFLLGPVGVIPSRQGSGIGSALIREALKCMKENGAEGIVLVGDPDYYHRFGFTSFPDLSYAGVPEQYVLGLSFTADTPAGEIVAHDAFRNPTKKVESHPEHNESSRRVHHYLSVNHGK